MTKWPHDPWLHRDGLLLHNPFLSWTEPARKRDGRGETVNRQVFLGEAQCDPYQIGAESWHMITAIWNDVHHIIESPEQVIRRCQHEIAIAKHLQDLRSD